MGADVRDHSRGAADGRIDPPGQAVLSPEGSVQPHPLLGILGGDGVDLSQHPVSDHLFGLLQNGVVGITVRHAEQKIFFLGQGLQLLRLPAGEGDGFVADNVEAVGNDVLDDLVVGVVGGGHHHKVQPVLPGALGFLLQHGVVVGIDAAGLHPHFSPASRFLSQWREKQPAFSSARSSNWAPMRWISPIRAPFPPPTIANCSFFIERPPDGLCKVYKKSSSGYHAGRQVSNSIQSWTHLKGTYKRGVDKEKSTLDKARPFGIQ